MTLVSVLVAGAGGRFEVVSGVGAEVEGGLGGAGVVGVGVAAGGSGLVVLVLDMFLFVCVPVV